MVTPGPISNPEVKHFIGEHSSLSESSTSPVQLKPRKRLFSYFLLVISLLQSLFSILRSLSLILLYFPRPSSSFLRSLSFVLRSLSSILPHLSSVLHPPSSILLLSSIPIPVSNPLCNSFFCLYSSRDSSISLSYLYIHSYDLTSIHNLHYLNPSASLLSITVCCLMWGIVLINV